MATHLVAPGYRVQLFGQMLEAGSSLDLSPADVVRMGDAVVPVPEAAPAQPEESAPADPAPVEAPRPSRSRKAAPVPAVPPTEDDAPAPEAG